MDINQLKTNLNKLIIIQLNTGQYEKKEWTEAYNILIYLNNVIKAKNRTQIYKTTKELDNYLKKGILWGYKIKPFLNQEQQKFMDSIYSVVYKYLLIRRNSVHKNYSDIITKLLYFQKTEIAPYLKNERYKKVNEYLNEIINILSNPGKVGLYEESEKSTLKGEINYIISLMKKQTKDNFLGKDIILERKINDIRKIINGI